MQVGTELSVGGFFFQLKDSCILLLTFIWSPLQFSCFCSVYFLVEYETKSAQYIINNINKCHIYRNSSVLNTECETETFDNHFLCFFFLSVADQDALN